MAMSLQFASPESTLFCISSATLIFAAKFNNEDFISGEFPNRSLNQQYIEIDKYGKERPINITGEAINTYCSQNSMVFGYNYLNLPDLTELCEIVEKKLV